MPINSLCAGLGAPLFRLWVPTGEPRLPCPLLSGRIIMVEDAQAFWLSPGFGYLRNKKKCSRARRGGEVRCLLGVGMAARGVGGTRRERGSALPDAISPPKLCGLTFVHPFPHPLSRTSRGSRGSGLQVVSVCFDTRGRGACAALGLGSRGWGSSEVEPASVPGSGLGGWQLLLRLPAPVPPLGLI